MAGEVFVDTSAFYALVVKNDEAHGVAVQHLKKRIGKRRYVTSDYVLDETATLLKARGYTRLLDQFFQSVLTSSVCRIEWMDPSRFERTRMLFLARPDHGYSFTDCFSFVLMGELRLRQALTKDHHFFEAGFEALLDGGR